VTPPGASATRRTSAARRAEATARAVARRRRIAVLLGAGIAALLLWPILHHAVREITLPLRHEDVIRQQARDKRLDASLIAGVIYAESKFREGRTSDAGAVGLMQITPDTARFIARRSGGSAFKIKDLGDAQVNISYGSYFLRYLLDRYGGNEPLALAAYNAGEGNVDKWIVDARSHNRPLTVAAIPFGETRAYVQRVLQARRDYRANYARDLGL
jgi:soluble lytic murein transglycosylase